MPIRRNNDPFPDMRDPTTGEWLPMSYSSQKAEQQAEIYNAQTKKSMRNMSTLLMSIFK